MVYQTVAQTLKALLEQERELEVLRKKKSIVKEDDSQKKLGELVKERLETA